MPQHYQGGQKALSQALRKLIRTADNRIYLKQVLRLKVDSTLPADFVSLLEALEQREQEGEDRLSSVFPPSTTNFMDFTEQV